MLRWPTVAGRALVEVVCHLRTMADVISSTDINSVALGEGGELRAPDHAQAVPSSSAGATEIIGKRRQQSPLAETERKRKRMKHDTLEGKKNRKTEIMDRLRGQPLLSLGLNRPVDSIELPIKPEYITKDGLRFVTPFYFNFASYVKRRWLKRTVLDVMNDEFYPSTDGQLEFFIEQLKRLRIDGQPITADFVLKDNQLLEHVVHRHETPVLDQRIEIIYDSNDLLVVNKPCSIPVHPCGRFRNNSLCMHLKWLHGIEGDLRLLHRLDRLTSGVLMFAKTLSMDQKMKTHFSTYNLEKSYLARVDGEFPESTTIVCKEPIAFLCQKMGISYVPPTNDRGNVKECETRFERQSYNGRSSVVRCYPKSGRTHQIRVHLQYLGHPICNDSLYNCSTFGPERGKGGDFGKSKEELIADLRSRHSRTVYAHENHDADAARALVEMKEHFALHGTSEAAFDPDRPDYDPYCFYCRLKYAQPTANDLTMYLHCWKYKIDAYEFEAAPPYWAADDFVEPLPLPSDATF